MKKMLFLILLSLLPMYSWCYDGEEFIGYGIVANEFTGAKNGVEMLFKVINEEKKECEVSAVSDNTRWVAPSIFNDELIEGVLEIPEEAIKVIDIKRGIKYKVTSIGENALQSCENLTSIVIPPTVTQIDDNAFLWCSSLKSIEIPENVTVIDVCAFYECTSLESVKFLGTKLMSIGGYTFSGCKSLKEIELPEGLNSIGDYAFENCESLAKVKFPQESLVSIGDGAFMQCTSLVTLAIPNSVIDIGGYAFNGCTSLTYADTGDGIESIDIWLFKDCSSLRVLKIGAGVVENNNSNNAFDGCTSLEDITIDCTLDPQNEIYFPEKESIKKITFGDNVRSIGGFYDDYPNLESVWIGKNVNSIKGAYDGSPFHLCPKLKTIIISKENTTYDSRNNCNAIIETSTNKLVCGTYTTVMQEGIKSIGRGAFSNCIYLTSIKIPNSVTEFDGYGVFNGCESLETIDIGDGIKDIGWNTFGGCDKLRTIRFGHGFEKVEGREALSDFANAFKYCNAIEEIIIDCNAEIPLNEFESEIKSLVFGDQVTCIEGYDDYSYLKTIQIGKNVSNIKSKYCPFSECKEIESISINAENRFFDSRNNCNAIIDTQTNTLIKGIHNTTIPNDIAAIGNYAFWGIKFDDNYTKIVLPKQVKTIGHNAFQGTNIVSVDIKDVKTIGKGAFSDTNNLISVILPFRLENIEDGTFSNSGITTINLPKGLTNIGDYAFSSTRISSIVFPESLTSIGDYAFSSTPITKIVFPASLIHIGDCAFAFCKNIESVTSHIMSPFIINYNVFGQEIRYFYTDMRIEGFTDATLYVPKGEKNSYETTIGWNGFKVIIDAFLGDANGDNMVNAADIVEMVNYINGHPSKKFIFSSADMNHDGKIDKTDINMVEENILSVSY